MYNLFLISADSWVCLCGSVVIPMLTPISRESSAICGRYCTRLYILCCFYYCLAAYFVFVIQNIIEKLFLFNLINGKPRDNVSIKAQVPNPDQAPSSQDLSLIEEELRASILRLSMIEGSIPGLGEDTDFTWNIMIITKPSGNLEQEG